MPEGLTEKSSVKTWTGVPRHRQQQKAFNLPRPEMAKGDPLSLEVPELRGQQPKGTQTLPGLQGQLSPVPTPYQSLIGQTQWEARGRRSPQRPAPWHRAGERRANGPAGTENTGMSWKEHSGNHVKPRGEEHGKQSCRGSRSNLSKK